MDTDRHCQVMSPREHATKLRDEILAQAMMSRGDPDLLAIVGEGVRRVTAVLDPETRTILEELLGEALGESFRRAAGRIT